MLIIETDSPMRNSESDTVTEFVGRPGASISAIERAVTSVRKTKAPGQIDFELRAQDNNGNGFRDPAFADNKTQPVHRWVPWIAGFSAQFVEDCFHAYLSNGRRIQRRTVLDPFAGVGTTLVRATLNGYNTVGFEINPYAVLACRVKLNSAHTDLQELTDNCERYLSIDLRRAPSKRSVRPADFRTKIPFFSDSIERQVLHFFDFVDTASSQSIADVFRLAFGAVMVKFSNYTYEPSLSSRPASGKPLIEQADVRAAILAKVRQMTEDMRWYQNELQSLDGIGRGLVYNRDFMESGEVLDPGSVDLMVTSPPYMNNYHYVRNTRPQLFWLEMVSSPSELKVLETSNFGKYWQTVRDMEPLALQFEHKGLRRVLSDLRNTRQEHGVYGGPGWANYVTSYFNDCQRFVTTLKRAMRRGSYGVVVIGNSIIQGFEIKTDVVLGDIARDAGLEIAAIHCLRTKRVGASITQSKVRRGENSKATLYESAVVLRKK
jgi:hypothetical protein